MEGFLIRTFYFYYFKMNPYILVKDENTESYLQNESHFLPRLKVFLIYLNSVWVKNEMSFFNALITISEGFYPTGITDVFFRSLAGNKYIIPGRNIMLMFS